MIVEIRNPKSEIRNKSKIQNPKLVINVQGKMVVVEFSGHRVAVELAKHPLLWGIAKVVKEPRAVRDIMVKIGHDATFSATRQVVAVANTLAWQLGVKVNGKKQMRAAYSGKPNITKPRV